MRFSQSDVAQWREQGFALRPRFLTQAEIAPVLDDFAVLYRERGKGPGVGQVLDVKRPGQVGASHLLQFQNIDTLPYNASSAINLISLHPAVIEFAQALLGVPKVHLYQSHTWAKYTGEADYDQAFHCDFGNHTLTVPADDVALRTVDFVLYLTDVTGGHGALHYVTKPDSDALLGPRFAERLVRDVGDQLRELARHAVDVAECRACRVGQARSFDHALRDRKSVV